MYQYYLEPPNNERYCEKEESRKPFSHYNICKSCGTPYDFKYKYEILLAMRERIHRIEAYRNPKQWLRKKYKKWSIHGTGHRTTCYYKYAKW